MININQFHSLHVVFATQQEREVASIFLHCTYTIVLDSHVVLNKLHMNKLEREYGCRCKGLKRTSRIVASLICIIHSKSRIAERRAAYAITPRQRICHPTCRNPYSSSSVVKTMNSFRTNSAENRKKSHSMPHNR